MSIEETVQHITAGHENNRKIYDDNKKNKNKPRSNARKSEQYKNEAEPDLSSKDKQSNDNGREQSNDNNINKEYVNERTNTNNVSKQLHKTNKRHSACTNCFANSEHERESHQNNNVISSPSSPSYSMSSTSPTYTSSLS